MLAAETAWTDLTEITSCFKNITKRNQYLRIVRVARKHSNMAVSVDHNSTMSDLRDFIKENKLKITTSGPGRTKDKILAEIKAMTTNEVTDKSSIQELRAYIQMKKLDRSLPITNFHTRLVRFPVITLPGLPLRPFRDEICRFISNNPSILPVTPLHFSHTHAVPALYRP